jgi:hypothetical protein
MTFPCHLLDARARGRVGETLRRQKLAGGRMEAHGQNRRDYERKRDASNTSRPAGPVEGLTEDGRPHQAPGEVAREVQAAGSAAISSRSVADEPGRCGLREERTHADEYHAKQNSKQFGHKDKRKAQCSQG